jgi:hypothetical protein
VRRWIAALGIAEGTCAETPPARRGVDVGASFVVGFPFSR